MGPTGHSLRVGVTKEVESLPLGASHLRQFADPLRSRVAPGWFTYWQNRHDGCENRVLGHRSGNALDDANDMNADYFEGDVAYATIAAAPHANRAELSLASRKYPDF